MLIDFHAHVLPELDHGCETVTIAKKQLMLADELGIDIIVASSHYTPYLESVQSYLKRREASFCLMEPFLEDYKVKILPAAEVLLVPGLNNDKELHRLCIKGTNTILVEMPMSEWEATHIDTFEQLCQSDEFNLVLAHIDRYPEKELRKLNHIDFRFQLNVDSITSVFQKIKLKKHIEDPNLVAIGSDIHGLGIGYKQFNRALRILGDRVSTIMDRTEVLIK